MFSWLCGCLPFSGQSITSRKHEPEHWSGHQTVDQSNDQSNNQFNVQSGNQPGDQSNDQSNVQSGNQSKDQPIDDLGNEPVDPSVDHPAASPTSPSAQSLPKEETEDVSERWKELEDTLNHLRSDLKKKDKELIQCKSTVEEQKRSAQHKAQEHQQEMSEMMAFYEKQLSESRSALKEKEEEFRSFKDKVAQRMDLSKNPENTENMNSPVNQSRLTEMYQQLRVCTWPNIHFPSSDQQARALVQEMFAAAAKKMKKLRKSIKKLNESSSSPKVDKFRHTALENLQLSLYHSNKEDVFKATFPQFKGGPAEVELASECYWLGCLMELNSPPLRPHWDSADEDRGTVFPRELQSPKH